MNEYTSITSNDHIGDLTFTRRREQADKVKARVPIARKRCRKFKKTEEGWVCSECGNKFEDLYSFKVCERA